MSYIVSYRKVIADGTTYRLREPDDSPCVELATVGGTTYVAVPDGVTLPVQPTQIAVETVVLDDATRDAIKAASPHVALINSRVVSMIRERYSIDDEIKMIRIAPSDESSEYGEYVEQCREWGRQQKAAIGLG